jgi:hypothetical protein
MKTLDSVLDAVCADLRADGLWEPSARLRAAAELEQCDGDAGQNQVANEKRHIRSLARPAKAVK